VKRAKQKFIKPGASWIAKLIFEYLNLELQQKMLGGRVHPWGDARAPRDHWILRIERAAYRVECLKMITKRLVICQMLGE
jgi:hypothetical protein